MRGRATVELALVDIIKLPTCNTMFTYLGERIDKLTEIAHRPISAWAVSETQDRCIFKDLHSLPRCSPLQALYVGALGAPHMGWPHFTTLPTPPHWAAAFRGMAPNVVVSATAAAWPITSEGESPNMPSLPLPEPSALEELLAKESHTPPSSPPHHHPCAFLCNVVGICKYGVPI